MTQDIELITQNIVLRGGEIDLMAQVIPKYISKGLILNSASMIPASQNALDEPEAVKLNITGTREMVNSFERGVDITREYHTPTIFSITVSNMDEHDLLSEAFHQRFGKRLKRPRLGLPRTTTVKSNAHRDRKFRELLSSKGIAF